MSVQILKKAFGLLIIDFVIIIGIFVLQFRTDSTIIEKTGNLQITIAKTDLDLSTNDSEFELKNKLKLSYNGISYFFDEQNPAKFKRDGGEYETAVLMSYSKLTPLSYRFYFDKKISMTVQLENDSLSSELLVSVSLPDDIQSFYIPYSYGYGMKIFKEETNNVVFQGRKSYWEMDVPGFADSYIVFTRQDSMAMYGVYSEVKDFSFEDLIASPYSDSLVLENNIKALKNNLISAFNANTVDSNITEQTLVSYVAAMAEIGRYTEAVDELTQNNKKNIQRTYISTPYFDSLSVLSADFEQNLKEMENQITKASYNSTLDIFAVRNLETYLCVHPNVTAVEKLLKNTATVDTETLRLEIAVGILQAYNGLYYCNKKYADLLEPAIQGCVQKITNCCKYENDTLSISENDTFLSVIQAVETGIVVMRYGYTSRNDIFVKAGSVIVNSYIADTSSFDLRTLANIYPIIAYDNWYYPHFQLITTNDDSKILAWTCAKNITYTKDGDVASTLTIDFPEGASQYLIVKGLKSFKKIYIYNTLFRTDPRFETYNSSGYIYKGDSNILLLKSKHKSRMEEIRFEY